MIKPYLIALYSLAIILPFIIDSYHDSTSSSLALTIYGATISVSYFLGIQFYFKNKNKIFTRSRIELRDEFTGIIFTFFLTWLILPQWILLSGTLLEIVSSEGITVLTRIIPTYILIVILETFYLCTLPFFVAIWSVQLLKFLKNLIRRSFKSPI